MALFETVTAIAQQQLQANQVLSGGLVLGALAAAAASARSIPGQVLDYCQRKLITSMELREDTQAQTWFKVWLSHSGVLKHTKSVVIDTRRQSVPHSIDDDDEERRKPMILSLPAPGIHLLWHEGWPYWLHIIREKIEGAYGGYINTYRLSTLGRGPEAMFSILDQGYELAKASDKGRIKIYSNTLDGWRLMDTKHKRSPESLVLAAGVFEDLLADVKQFLADEDWYHSIGVPWHRGYLLAGPAGTGKSTSCFVLASELNSPVYCLNLSQDGMTDATMIRLIADMPANGILLLEEIDTVFVGRSKNKEAGNESKLSFGGLLNALDGVAAQDGRLVFMTTNHPEKLDPALVRPGRVDKQLYIGPATYEQALRLFTKFYGDPAAAALQWASTHNQSFKAFFETYQVPMAALQGLFMAHRHDPVAALWSLDTLIPKEVEEQPA